MVPVYKRPTFVSKPKQTNSKRASALSKRFCRGFFLQRLRHYTANAWEDNPQSSSIRFSCACFPVPPHGINLILNHLLEIHRWTLSSPMFFADLHCLPDRILPSRLCVLLCKMFTRQQQHQSPVKRVDVFEVGSGAIHQILLLRWLNKRTCRRILYLLPVKQYPRLVV